MSVVWSLLVEPDGRPGAENMAIDEALLFEADRTGAAFLRLYRFSPPTLSFGRNEPALTVYDRASIARRGMPVVRRPTGGRAVWHEHEVTYAVAAPIALFGSLRDAYLSIHRRLAAALQSLGAATSLAERPSVRPPVRPSAQAGSCFASPAGGEILAGGKKLVGSAQMRHGAVFLQHGSILLDGSQEVVDAFSHQPSAVSGETTLRAVLGRPVGFSEVAEAITAAWETPLQPVDRPRIRPSAYSDPAWTWRR